MSSFPTLLTSAFPADGVVLTARADVWARGNRERVPETKDTLDLLKGIYYRASTPATVVGFQIAHWTATSFICSSWAEHMWGQKSIINIPGVTMRWLIRGDISLSAQWKQSSLSICKHLSCFLYRIFYSLYSLHVSQVNNLLSIFNTSYEFYQVLHATCFMISCI